MTQRWLDILRFTAKLRATCAKVELIYFTSACLPCVH